MNRLTLTFFTATLFATHASAADPAFNLNDIFTLIKTDHVRTIEELLPKLPVSLRSNYTFMYDSRSLQHSSPTSPRAIMFTADAKLSCAFNGDPALAGYDDFECYQFDDKRSAFEFRQIEFPSPRNHLKEVIISKPNQTVSGNISCTTCHTRDPRPNWEGYKTWTGAYGTHDDCFNTKTCGSEYPKEIAKEEKNFAEFKKENVNSPRYKNLPKLFSGGPHAPYSETLDNDNALRPNFRFTHALKILMAKRDTRLSQKLSRTQRLLFLAAVAGCPVTASEAAVCPGDFVKSSPPGNVLIRPYGPALSKTFIEQEWTPAFRRLGMNCSNCMSQGLDPLTYDYTNGDFTPLNSYVATEVMRKLIHTSDPDLAPYYKLKSEAAIAKELLGEANEALSTNPIVVDINSLTLGCALLSNKIATALNQEAQSAVSITTQCEPRIPGQGITNVQAKTPTLPASTPAAPAPAAPGN